MCIPSDQSKCLRVICSQKGMIVHFNSNFVALSSMVLNTVPLFAGNFSACEHDFSVATKIMYMQRNGSFYTKNYRKQRSRMKLQHRMKSAKVHKHQSVFTKKNARLMIEVEIAIEIHQYCCYATPTLFFQKNTYFGIDNVLANSKLSMHCSARCRDQKVFFGLRNVEADKHKWIRIQETPETPETPYLFVCFFSVLDFSHVNVNRLFQFACKVSILIVNGYQFERSKGVALRFSFFTGLDATRLPSCICM